MILKTTSPDVLICAGFTVNPEQTLERSIERIIDLYVDHWPSIPNDREVNDPLPKPVGAGDAVADGVQQQQSFHLDLPPAPMKVFTCSVALISIGVTAGIDSYSFIRAYPELWWSAVAQVITVTTWALVNFGLYVRLLNVHELHRFVLEWSLNNPDHADPPGSHYRQLVRDSHAVWGPQVSWLMAILMFSIMATCTQNDISPSWYVIWMLAYVLYVLLPVSCYNRTLPVGSDLCFRVFGVPVTDEIIFSKKAFRVVVAIVAFVWSVRTSGNFEAVLQGVTRIFPSLWAESAMSSVYNAPTELKNVNSDSSVPEGI
jgi:hypothetical protein